MLLARMSQSCAMSYAGPVFHPSRDGLRGRASPLGGSPDLKAFAGVRALHCQCFGLVRRAHAHDSPGV
jgi:hypothetical protein